MSKPIHSGRVSSRVCVRAGAAFIERGGRWEAHKLGKKHCGKMVGMVDLKPGKRRQTYAVIQVRGQRLAVPIAGVKNT